MSESKITLAYIAQPLNKPLRDKLRKAETEGRLHHPRYVRWKTLPISVALLDQLGIKHRQEPEA